MKTGQQLTNFILGATYELKPKKQGQYTATLRIGRRVVGTLYNEVSADPLSQSWDYPRGKTLGTLEEMIESFLRAELYLND